ncbi:blast:LINE-1 retrotransposable element ORF2 protein [Mytilus galloprovincialis]|uniref:Blast:LINE-1 retrotransposable element ORF2 protein n=1 Tax=Mytilus galloprovincialis TaxID=29158 RepID=A0A8B6D7K4_MYTGA|nr:blast:LINE-1 retrotransposable element ORF2 protein [Mytilus galloprovincialis]
MFLIIAMKKKELTNSQKLGLITLIYKKNDPLNLDNYRPITLLNVDTKIIAYSLAQRLKPILHKIIHSDQNGYVKNRYIGFNIRQIQDIIDYSEKFNVDGAILFLDFTKAFDSLEWEFMYCSLKKFGFQESLLRWINTLYTDIKGCILNNGWISRPFNIERGIRQGCPASSIIFVIAVEILASRLRQNKSFKGFQIKLDNKTHTLKLSQLADDTTLFFKFKTRSVINSEYYRNFWITFRPKA